MTDTDIIEQQLRDAIDRGDAAEMNRLGDLLDAADAERVLPSLASSALWYAEQGLHVFPLIPFTKYPFRGSRGRDDGTSDEAQVRAWWERTPEANIGIATGHLVDIVDIDGPPGVRSWVKLMDSLPPIVGVVNTPRPGGTHLYVRSQGLGSRAGLIEGVDYRGQGGYLIAPPSVLGEAFDPDGELKWTPGTYRWTRPLDLQAMKAVA